MRMSPTIRPTSQSLSFFLYSGLSPPAIVHATPSAAVASTPSKSAIWIIQFTIP